MTYQENVISNVTKYLKKENITQKDFAKNVNCSESTLSRYLKKKRNLSLDFVISVSKTLKIDLERLVGLNEGTIQR